MKMGMKLKFRLGELTGKIQSLYSSKKLDTIVQKHLIALVAIYCCQMINIMFWLFESQKVKKIHKRSGQCQFLRANLTASKNPPLAKKLSQLTDIITNSLVCEAIFLAGLFYQLSRILQPPQRSSNSLAPYRFCVFPNPDHYFRPKFVQVFL